jgi:hypothetical protein
MQETRTVELPYCGVKDIRNMEAPALSMISVAVHELDAPLVLEPDWGVPAPIRVNPTPPGADRFEVHVQLPAGMLIVSPLTTVCVGPLMTAFTSE